MKKILKFMIPLVIILTLSMQSFAQIPGVWLNEDKDAKVEIYLAKDGKYYGKIVWLKNPNDAKGNPKVDAKNPDKNKRSNPLLNAIILKGFTKKSDTLMEDGTIYDPKNGKTYDCKMTLEGNVLSIRGYVGISMLGRTTKWQRSSK